MNNGGSKGMGVGDFVACSVLLVHVGNSGSKPLNCKCISELESDLGNVW